MLSTVNRNPPVDVVIGRKGLAKLKRAVLCVAAFAQMPRELAPFGDHRNMALSDIKGR